VITVLNTAIAIYYYLRIVRETFFGETTGEPEPIKLSPTIAGLCIVLVILITALGVMPGTMVDAIGSSLPTAIGLPG
jgi:NADH-quinone oxidoreductase subunit N